MKKTRKMVAVLLSTVVAIGGLTGCGGGGSSSTVQTNDKGEITELVDARAKFRYRVGEESD